MPSESYQQQHSEAIQNLSSHFVLASDGQRVQRGSRLKSPCQAEWPVVYPLALQCESRTAQSIGPQSGLDGRVGGRKESLGFAKLQTKRESSRLRGSLPAMPFPGSLGPGPTL